MFEATGTSSFDNLFNAILTVSPTSLETKQVFSISGKFCNITSRRLSINANYTMLLKQILMEI